MIFFSFFFFFKKICNYRKEIGRGKTFERKGWWKRERRERERRERKQTSGGRGVDFFSSFFLNHDHFFSFF